MNFIDNLVPRAFSLAFLSTNQKAVILSRINIITLVTVHENMRIYQVCARDHVFIGQLHYFCGNFRLEDECQGNALRAWRSFALAAILWADWYTRKNARSVTAFNSTDIRSVQDNVATPVTAMMVTVCISTDVLYILVCSCSLQQSVPIRLIQP